MGIVGFNSVKLIYRNINLITGSKKINPLFYKIYNTPFGNTE